eukprot:6178428-Alexandrium_andersonii.AAC.1
MAPTLLTRPSLRDQNALRRAPVAVLCEFALALAAWSAVHIVVRNTLRGGWSLMTTFVSSRSSSFLRGRRGAVRLDGRRRQILAAMPNSSP